MTGITMYDSAFNNQFPAGGQAYAAYVDGQVGNQPNYPYIVAAYPQAFHLSITLDPGLDADTLDIEAGAATPESAAAWYQRQKARGVSRPCFYASASVMQAAVIPVILAAQFPRAGVRLWSAHYGFGEHICAPDTCGLVSMAMDGTQWTDCAMGKTLDQSILLPGFFTTPPAPEYVEFDMSKLPVLQQGDTDQPGEFWSVHRLQALVAVTGKLNGITAAAGLAEDGDFGPLTAAAVGAVQARYAITQDEICGQETWGVLLTGSAAA